MPKSTDKNGTKRRKTRNSTLNTPGIEGSEAKVTPKRKKLNPDDGIAVSKQLASKLQKRTRTTNTNSASNKSSEPRICPNGKPMPSLAELESMYEDSDGDEEPPATTKTIPERSGSPIRTTSTFNDHNAVSPTVLEQITSKVIDLLSNIPDPIVLDDDGPPPPVIPQKRPKKSDRPYIDGCKDRPQVPWNPKSVVGKSNDKYGIKQYDDSDDEENMCPKKRRKMSNCGNISKSIFNAQSDDIAAMLKECESREQVSGSPDSNKTVSYDYSDNSPTRNLPRSFSPLPSTSRDSETILKNDQLFNESFQCENAFNDKIENDVDIIEVPCETIVIDTIPTSANKVVEPLDNMDDDCCIIVESNIKTKREPSPVTIEDDFYSTLDLTQNFYSEDCEVIDVDDVIAENTAIIKKYRKESNLDCTITCVDPNVSYVPKRQSANEQNVIPSEQGHADHVVDPDIPHAVSADVCQNDDPPLEHSLHSPAQQVNTNNTQSDVQASTTTNSCQNTANRNNKIAEVVTNFFNQSEDTRQSSSSPIDLTTDSRSIISKISSWMLSSIESYLYGNESTAQAQKNFSPLSTNANAHNTSHNHSTPTLTSHPTSRSICHQNMPMTSRSRNNDPVNVMNVPLLQRQHRTPRRRSRRHNNLVLSDTNSSPDVTSISQVNQVTSVPQTQPPVQPMDESPVRSFGDCPICMDSFANNAVASTLCGHVFCMNCIKAAIKANGKKCPTCRKTLKGVGYHQLFL